MDQTGQRAIPAYIVGAELFMVWLFVIFLMPEPWRGHVYMILAAFFVGTVIGKIVIRIKRGKWRFSDYLIEALENRDKTMIEMLHCLKISRAATQACLARIDQLMFEYCPEEMTPEQIANYEAHQRPATKEEQEAVDRALEITEQEYREMLYEAEILVSLDPVATSDQGKRLLHLVTRIERYENLHFPLRGKKSELH